MLKGTSQNFPYGSYLARSLHRRCHLCRIAPYVLKRRIGKETRPIPPQGAPGVFLKALRQCGLTTYSTRVGTNPVSWQVPAPVSTLCSRANTYHLLQACKLRMYNVYKNLSVQQTEELLCVISRGARYAKGTSKTRGEGNPGAPEKAPPLGD